MSTKTSVFEHLDYKRYLAQALPTRGPERGVRSRLATALKCQSTFISQVLGGDAHFSPEHGLQIGRFLKLSADELAYFMLLLQAGRAGSRELREFYVAQLRAIQLKRQEIGERVETRQALSREAEMTYCGRWYYAAIHMLLQVPRYRTREAIAAKLRLPVEVVAECLEFLVSIGLAVREGPAYRTGEVRIHFGKDSPMLAKHHANWRLRALHSLDVENREDLHFSSVMSLSAEAAKTIHAMILDLIERSEPMIRDARDEDVVCLAVDLFRVGEG